MPEIEKYSEKTFEDIKHINADGIEFWYARELQTVLEYSEWRNFLKVIEKAMIACQGSENTVESHFVDVNKSSPMPNGGERIIDDIQLSRYACYLIVQNGDPRKEVIALGQTYFAVKTRQQELIENYDELSENQKRIAIRNEIINFLILTIAKHPIERRSVTVGTTVSVITIDVINIPVTFSTVLSKQQFLILYALTFACRISVFF